MCGSYLCISLQSVIDVEYCAVCIPALKLKSMYLRGFYSKSVPFTSGRGLGLSLPTHVHTCRYTIYTYVIRSYYGLCEGCLLCRQPSGQEGVALPSSHPSMPVRLIGGGVIHRALGHTAIPLQSHSK